MPPPTTTLQHHSASPLGDYLTTSLVLYHTNTLASYHTTQLASSHTSQSLRPSPFSATQAGGGGNLPTVYRRLKAFSRSFSLNDLHANMAHHLRAHRRQPPCRFYKPLLDIPEQLVLPWAIWATARPATQHMELESLMDQALAADPHARAADHRSGVGRPRKDFTPPLGVVGAKPPKLRYTHDGLVDLIIAHPEWSQNRLAEEFGYSAGWISTILTSDAFQARLSERRKDVVDPALMATVEHRFKAVTLRSLEVIAEKLNRAPEQIPDQLALQALQIASRAAGFGARDLTPPASPVSVHVHLEEMKGNLTRLIRHEREPADLRVGVLPAATIAAVTQED